jgi:hypothetical protein
VHGTVPKLTFCTLTTDKGANGLGLLRSGKEKAQELFAAISELEFHLSKCNQQI